MGDRDVGRTGNNSYKCLFWAHKWWYLQKYYQWQWTWAILTSLCFCVAGLLNNLNIVIALPTQECHQNTFLYIWLYVLIRAEKMDWHDTTEHDSPSDSVDDGVVEDAEDGEVVRTWMLCLCSRADPGSRRCLLSGDWWRELSLSLASSSVNCNMITMLRHWPGLVRPDTNKENNKTSNINKHKNISSTSNYIVHPLWFMTLYLASLNSLVVIPSWILCSAESEWFKVFALLTLFLSVDSILSLQDGLRSCCLSASPAPATRVAEVVTVVLAVEPGRAGEAGAGDDPPAGELMTSCCSSVVLAAFSCCCFFFTSCSADLRSSRVTPWVDLLVSLTLLAWAFLWISCSSSRTGGTNDLQKNSFNIMT